MNKVVTQKDISVQRFKKVLWGFVVSNEEIFVPRRYFLDSKIDRTDGQTFLKLLGDFYEMVLKNWEKGGYNLDFDTTKEVCINVMKQHIKQARYYRNQGNKNVKEIPFLFQDMDLVDVFYICFWGLMVGTLLFSVIGKL